MTISLFLEYTDLYLKYPGWDKGNMDAYMKIGMAGDIEAIERIRESFIVQIPFEDVCVGAIKADNVNMVSYIMNEDTTIDKHKMADVARRRKSQLSLDYLSGRPLPKHD
jgi:hypothetical protein